MINFSFLTRNKPIINNEVFNVARKEWSVAEAMRDSTVTGCVRILSDLVGQLPMVSNHKNTSIILSNPNFINTPHNFVRLMVQNSLLFGECFIQIVRSPTGRVVQLNVIDNDVITTGLNSAFVPTYSMKVGKEVKSISNSNMIHIRDLLTTGIKVNSRVELNLHKIRTLLSCNELINTTFKNGTNIKLHIQSEKNLNNEQKKAYSEYIKNTFSSTKGNSQTVITSDASSVTELKGATPADYDLRELKKGLIDEVAAIFGVPSDRVGGNADQKYSNVRQKNTALYRDVIAPIVGNIEQEFSRKLKVSVYFDVTNLLKGDIESQVRIATQSYSGGIVSANEAREQIGLPRLEGEKYDILMPPKTFEPDDTRGSEDEPNDMNPESNRGNEENTDDK